MRAYGELKILSGSANPALADGICEHLGCRRSPMTITTFADGEIRVEIQENIRGADVFIIQPTCPPVNNHIMELALILDALRRASAGRVSAVVPYYGYARQDTKILARSSIGAKLVADILTNAGMRRMLTVDLHAGQIQGFFDIPVDNLYSAPVMVRYLRQLGEDLIIVSPDAAGVERVRNFMKRLGVGMAIIDQRSEGVANVIGNVEGMVAVVVDDMIDSAGRTTTAADALLAHGAREVYACATHPVLSGKAVDRIEASPLREVIVTDTIPLSERAKASPKIKSLSVASLLAKAIHNTHTESSITVLFE